MMPFLTFRVAVAIILLSGGACSALDLSDLARGPEPAPVPTGPAVDPGSTARSGQGLRTPMFWTWSAPKGAARNHPHVIAFVRKMTHPTPEEVADQVCTEIRNRRLRQGEVAILLQNFGMGDGAPRERRGKTPALFNHWADGLAHKPRPGSDQRETLAAGDAAPIWWATPWSRHGVADCKEWMRRFIGKYQRNQARWPDIPAPSRFHFDSEDKVVPTRKGSVLVFAAMQRDPRWSEEPIAGFDGRTMAQLYEEAGRPPFDPSREFNQQADKRWIAWYGGVCNQAADGAMSEAAYRQIRAAWPACLSSNYGAARFDGTRPLRNTGHQIAFRNFGELQAPVLYVSNAEHSRTRRAKMNVSAGDLVREIVQANRNSYGGPHLDITPWILIVTADNPPSLADEVMGILKAEGIEEFLLFTGANPSVEQWNAFMQVAGSHWPQLAR